MGQNSLKGSYMDDQVRINEEDIVKIQQIEIIAALVLYRDINAMQENQKSYTIVSLLSR